MALRVTNRLLDCMQPTGTCVYVESDTIKTCMVQFMEVEIDWTSPAAAVGDAGFSTEFSLFILKGLKNDHDDTAGYEFGLIRDSGQPCRRDTSVPVKEGSKFDIVWISSDTFITLHKFYYSMDGPSLESLWEVRTQIDGSKWPLHLRSERMCGLANELGPARVLPIRVFAHLLVPIFHMLPWIFIAFMPSGHLVVPTLSLVPTSLHNIPTPIKISFWGATSDLLLALGSHPFHPQVLLCFAGRSDHLDLQVKNDLLRAFRLPVHLQVPQGLLSFECVGEPFTVNPAFTRLTIPAVIDQKLSSRLIDGIARNGSIACLTLDCRDWKKPDSECPEWIGTMFRRVVFGNSSSIRLLTVVLSHEIADVYQDNTPIENHLEAFNRLTQLVCLNSINRHGLSTFRLTFPDRCFVPSTSSNETWDSRFAPSSLLNWLSEHGHECPSMAISGLAVQRINQGMLYGRATNLRPCDLRTSSASTIFNILHQAIIRQGRKDRPNAEDSLREMAALPESSASLQKRRRVDESLV
jgi:hypothetical protein